MNAARQDIRRREVFDALAVLLAYPGADFTAAVRVLNEALGEGDAGGQVRRFAAATLALAQGEREELYTRTFDLNPDASLETGWQLHGETYERGAHLVRMRELLRRCGVEESGELPDHLTPLLRALGRMSEADASSFARACLARPVAKALDALPGEDNPYRALLQAARLLIDELTAVKETATP